MPEKVWTDEVDFDDGTFYQTESTVDGKLKLESGKVDGWWRSQIYEALAWVHWSTLNLEANRPVGTVVLYRFRSGASSAECGSATWSPYLDDFGTDGTLHASLAAYFLNNPSATVGKYIQVEIYLMKE